MTILVPFIGEIPMPTLLELSAILFTAVCIFLAGRNSVHTWWTGIVACIFYGFVFYDAKLYADMVLQGFFIGTGILGWKMWNADIDKRPQKYMSSAQFAAAVIFGAFVTGLYSLALYYYTDAAAPLWDSAILAFSVIAQLLLMSRYVHTWPMWVIVNIISVPLYWSRDLHLSAVLYSVFLVHAIWATYYWLKLNKGSAGAYVAPQTVTNMDRFADQRISFSKSSGGAAQ